MKICAIICEYNPLHYGHKKQIMLAREKSDADAIMCIMGGNFSQRGEPCVVNKYVRARMALEVGADIVVQIPTAYVCSSAQTFALAGVKIANSFDNVTHLAFGVECNNEKLLLEIGDYLAKEPKEFKTLLKKYLSEGESIASSREKALVELLKQKKVKFCANVNTVVETLRQPNNILAIEYLKCLAMTNSKIKPLFIHRDGDYNSTKLAGKETSSTAIRSLLYRKNNVGCVKKYIPNECYNLLKEEIKTFGMPNRELFDDFALFSLKTKQPSDLKHIFDVSEGLENRFCEQAKQTKDLNELLINVKTKRYSFSRLKRIIINLMLDINAKVIKDLYEIDVLPYIKVLGFKSENKKLLKGCSANTNLIIRNSNVEKNPSQLYKDLNIIEERANQIYNLLLKKSKKIVNYKPDLLTKSIVL